MNKIDLFKLRDRNFSLLERGYRPKINAVEVNMGHSLKHEQAKLKCLWILRMGYEPEQLEEMLPHADTITDLIKKRWERPMIVSEARFIQKSLRADLFHLDKSTVIEIVNSEGSKSIERKKRAYKNLKLNFVRVDLK